MTSAWVRCAGGTALRCPNLDGMENTGLQVGDFVHSLGDAHLYLNHVEQARLQLQRSPGPLPQLELINPPDELTDFRFEHITLSGYEAAPSIPAPIAV